MSEIGKLIKTGGEMPLREWLSKYGQDRDTFNTLLVYLTKDKEQSVIVGRDGSCLFWDGLYRAGYGDLDDLDGYNLVVTGYWDDGYGCRYVETKRSLLDE